MASMVPTEGRPRGFSLTDEQRRAVEWGDGPLMVLAGAGTGKTTVVVERVRHLLVTDPTLQPENVLVLTYNVRAAGELTDRLERALGIESASRLWVHNFHSFGFRLLNEHRAELGLAESADVLDQVGQRLLLRELRPRLAHFLYHRVASDNSGWVLGRFADLISRAKDELVTPEEYDAFARAKREAFELQFGAGAYEQAIEEIRVREAEGRMRGVRDTRGALRNGHEEATKTAWREARREATGGGYATAWADLTHQQQQLARGLKDTFLRDAAAYDVLRLEEEAEAYRVYEEELHRRGLLDFGEQMLRTIQLLRYRPNLLRRYQEQFRHVLVDEFQDANMAQILLLELVGRGPDKPDNVVVVGDDDQSIYRFRGASYAAFSEFERRFNQPPAGAPDRPVRAVQRLPLLQNRRSTARILSAAGRLIEHNRPRLKAEPLQPVRERGTPVELVYARDESDEAEAIVARIRALFDALPDRLPTPDGGERAKRWSDIAVLYRKHRHREQIVERLRRASIPHVVVGGTGLFAIPEVRDVEAALRVAANPDDSVSFVRLLTAGPWRLDGAEILRLTRLADWDGRSVFQAARDALGRGELRAGDALDPQLRIKLERVMAVVNDLAPRGTREAPFPILEDYLVRTNLLHDLIAVETPEAQRVVLAVARLMRFVADWQRSHPRLSLKDFVDYLDVYQQVGGDLDTDLPGRVEVEGVQLMTVYQAKGLEYEVVFVPRLVEGQFPDLREENAIIPIELLKQQPPPEFAIAEERRLCFVAMTRARRHLVMTAIDSPNGKPPSRFVGEVGGQADADAGADRATTGNGRTTDAPAPSPDDVLIVRREPAPDAEVEVGGRTAEQAAEEATSELVRLMPVPEPFERRFSLRRRAVELIGALEALPAEDEQGRRALIDELVAVATDAANAAEEERRNGIDPLTLRVLSRHAPAGRQLLELAPLPGTISNSQIQTYEECPLRYAFQRVYRIPVPEEKGYFEFGGAIHAAFEAYTRARKEAHAAGLPPPGFEALQQAFQEVWRPTAYPDSMAADHYRRRSEPALRRFFDRELETLAQAVDFEVPFTVELDGDGSEPVRFTGIIDRIDRHPDGSIEITDYKTGRPKTQYAVDRDDQLTGYALALREGAVRDRETHEVLPPASRLTLYFTETDQAVSTMRTDEQLDAFRERVLSVAARIRSGDFTAKPDYWRCQGCDYRRICPSRWGHA